MDNYDKDKLDEFAKNFLYWKNQVLILEENELKLLKEIKKLKKKLKKK